jgi:hypothetical protein
MKHDEKRRGFYVSPEEIAELNALMQEARNLAALMDARARYGWPTIPTQGGKKLLN